MSQKYIRKYNHYNQRMLDFAMRVHNKCMHHCLDDDRDAQDSTYTAHHMIHELMVIECNRSAQNDNADRMSVHTVDIPMIERYRYNRSHKRIC